MLRLFRFLLLLRARKFWGEVTIRFKDGEISGQIQANTGYIVDNLPQPIAGTPTACEIAAQERGELAEAFKELRGSV